MILAGGLSTRLYPLTREVPKPLVPVAGVPNAEHVVAYLREYGFDDIAINVHYLPDAIVAALGDGSRLGVRLEYSYESELLGSAGGVKRMQPFFGDEPFAVVGCDDLTDLPLDDVLAFHRERGAVATIGLVECERVDQYGVVVTDGRGRIVEFQEKPAPGTERSHLANTGIYVFSPAIFDRIPAETFYDFGKQVFPQLQSENAPFFGFHARGAYWSDIGTPEEYRRASYDVVRGVFTIPGSKGRGVDPSATLGERVTIDGPVWIGPNARVGDGVSLVGPCVIGNDASIDADASLERSILWDGATVGSGARLRDAIVGRGYAVAPGTVLDGAIVANGA